MSQLIVTMPDNKEVIAHQWKWPGENTADSTGELVINNRPARACKVSYPGDFTYFWWDDMSFFLPINVMPEYGTELKVRV